MGIPQVGHIELDYAMKLLVCCLQTTLDDQYSDWLRDMPLTVIISCCGFILNETHCLIGRDGRSVDESVQLKLLTLSALNILHEHTNTLNYDMKGY